MGKGLEERAGVKGQGYPWAFLSEMDARFQSRKGLRTRPTTTTSCGVSPNLS